MHQIYGNSFSTDIFYEVKSETDKSIGETENYSVHRRLEQYRLQQATQSSEHYISHDNEEEWEL